MIYLVILFVAQSPESNPMLVHVGFVKDNVSLEENLSHVPPFHRFIVFPQVLNTISMNTNLQS